MRAEMRARERAARGRRNAMVAALAALSLLVGGLVYWWPESRPLGGHQVASGLASTPGTDSSTTPGTSVDWRTLAIPADLADSLEPTDPPAAATSTPAAPAPTSTSAPGSWTTQPPAPVTSTDPPASPSSTPSTSTSRPGPSTKEPNPNKPTKSPKPQEGVRADCSLDLFGICL